MKELILLSGLPGSGKSTYIRKHLGHAEVISSDEIRLSLTGSYALMAPNMQDVYDEMIKRANEIFLRHGDVVVALDSTFLDDCRRNYFLDRIVGQDRTALIMLKAHSLDTVFARNSSRAPQKRVPERVIKEMATRYKEPSKEDENRYNSIEEVWID